MYKQVSLNNYEQEKLKAYQHAACSRFEISEKLCVRQLKNVDFLYALSKAVNETNDLKKTVLGGNVVEFDKLNPAYMLEKDGEIVSTYTEFDYEYSKFLQNYEDDYKLFANSELVFHLKKSPVNVFHVSSFKDSFNSFSLHLKHGFDFYQPVFTTYKKDKELTVYANFHHAFFDLKKAKDFFNKLDMFLNSSSN